MENNLRKTMNSLPGERFRSFFLSLASLARNPLVLFCLVLLVSAICKLSALNSRELWLDETYSAFVANLPFAELLRHTTGDVHPPLFYALLWAWIRIAGDAPAQLRLFSVVLSICASLGIFVLARRLLGSRFGAFAAALFALSPMLFVYSLEVRMYMLIILIFVCLLMVHWAVAIEQREEKWLVAAYGLLAALLFYAHYIGIFVLIGLFAHWTITTAFARSRMAKLCTAALLTILLVSPGIPVLFEQHAGKTQMDLALKLSHQNPSALSFGPAGQDLTKSEEMKGMAKSAAAMAGFYPAASSLLLLLCAVPLVLALAVAGYLALVKGDEVCRLFAVVALATGMGMVALHLSVTRHMLILVPLLVMAVARAVQYGTAKRRWRVPSLALAILILCLYSAGFFRQAFMPHGRPWQNVVSVVQQNYRPGDEVIFNALYSQAPFDYFARQARFQPQEGGFPLSIYDWWNQQGFKGWGGPVILQSDLDQFVAGLAASRTKTVWLILCETNYYDPHNALLERLRQLGEVTEVSLPPDPDAHDAQENLRLIRISMKD